MVYVLFIAGMRLG